MQQHARWFWAKYFLILSSTWLERKQQLSSYNATLTFDVVSSIMVDFSKIDLAAPISAFKISSFKSW